jgi:NADH-quinone oxidoreductase subunit F
MLSEAGKKEIRGLLKRYPTKRSALLSALHVLQREHGYLPKEGMVDVAEILEVAPVHVLEAATFYTLYNLQPMGKYLIQVCHTLSCGLMGANPLILHLQEKLGIKVGETTQDRMFSLKTVECLASCGTAPMMQINDDYYENLTNEKVDQILSDLRTKGKSPLASGPFKVPVNGDADAVKRGNLILFKNMMTPDYSNGIQDYEKQGGYKTIRKMFKEHTPQTVIDIVKKSGLRGRGGAGFPTGTKWDFIPKDPNQTKYLCCNADESEPGTFKDRQLIERDPHQIIEGIIIACFAIGAHTAYIYIRGEFAFGAKILEQALEEAYKAGYLGKNILGSGFDVDVYVHRGAGAYICGEETALLESIEGKRGLPRVKPPFPATHGLYGKPTVVNNIETLSNLPHIIMRGADWFTAIGSPPKSTGTRLFCVAGHVKRPGNYEVAMGITFRELIYDYAGGILNDRKLKAFIPGGASAAFFTEQHLDVKLDFDLVAQAGSMLGSGGVTIMDDTTCMVWAALSLMNFFHHESCGKCTPCREGSGWLFKILQRIENGEGQEEDLVLMPKLCGNIAGRTVCAFGDAEVAPVLSTLKYFREEYEKHIREKQCPFPREGRLLSIGH